jgi:hypothetical protein
MTTNERTHLQALTSEEPHADLRCPSQFWTMLSFAEPLQRRILILPSAFSEITTTLSHYRDLSPEYAISIHYNFEGTVPFVHLPGPLKDLSNTLKFHPPTPTLSYRDHILSLPVWAIAIQPPTHSHSLHPGFELPRQFRNQALPTRIGLGMSIQLIDIGMSTEHSSFWVYPNYRVVGSLGLKFSPSKEILLLKTEGVPPNNPYRYVQLEVHPTQVAAEVGFVLTFEGGWRFMVRNKVREWQESDPSIELREKVLREELLYAQYVVNLRDQVHV